MALYFQNDDYLPNLDGDKVLLICIFRLLLISLKERVGYMIIFEMLGSCNSFV